MVSGHLQPKNGIWDAGLELRRSDGSSGGIGVDIVALAEFIRADGGDPRHLRYG